LLVPAQPNLAFAILVPVFMLDQALNSGILIANNGFMIKNSPTENRTMYIAACQALAGLVGGITSILAGLMLKNMAGMQWNFLGATWGHYHVMFAASIVLRWVSAAWVHRLREPNSKSTQHIIDELLNSPVGRFLASPAGAFLALRGEEFPEELEDAKTVEIVIPPEIAGEAAPPSAERNKIPSPKLIGRRSRKPRRVTP
jgi:hypothetical protein